MGQNSIQTILITGASSGIGKALALYYARNRHRLFLGGRDGERLEAVAQSCRSLGAEVHTQIIDIRADAITHQWIVGVDKRYPIDLVIANAGISGGTSGLKVEEFTTQAQHIFDVNMMGVLNTIHPVLPRMAARKKGQIALISSLAGFAGYPGAPAYSASKAAIRVYGEALQEKFSKSGVRICVVCPGFVRSAITEANNFPMPMLMEADYAAQKIAKGLSRNKALIVFPYAMGIAARLIGILPLWLRGRLLSKAPEKTSLQKI